MQVQNPPPLCGVGDQCLSIPKILCSLVDDSSTCLYSFSASAGLAVSAFSSNAVVDDMVYGQPLLGKRDDTRLWPWEGELTRPIR